jgi:hypothetical protein
MNCLTHNVARYQFPVQRASSTTASSTTASPALQRGRVSRRSFIGLTGGAVASSVLGWPSAAFARGLDLTAAEDLLTAAVKMRGATDNSLALGWVAGYRYAVIDGRSIPMFGLLAGTYSRYRKLDSLAYEVRSFEVAFFTDMVSGELLETWKNPVTGKTVDVPTFQTPPAKYRITPEGLDLSEIKSMQGMNPDHLFRPVQVNGEDVRLTEEIKIYAETAPAGAKPFRYTEVTTYQAKKPDIDNPALVTVPTSIKYQSLVSFDEWMGMDGIDGLHMGSGSGDRVARVEDFPGLYLELTERFYPDVLEDPLALLDSAK